MLGAGYLRSSIPGDAENGFGANVGIGFLKQLTESMALRADARYRITESSLSGADSRPGDWLVNLGLNIALGAKPATQPSSALSAMAVKPPAIAESAAANDQAKAMAAPVITTSSASAASAPSTSAASAPSTSAASAQSTSAAPAPSTPAAPAPSTPVASTPSTPAASAPSTPAAPAPSTPAASAPSTPAASAPSTPAASAAIAPVALPAPLDSDGDGIADALDKCPGTPAGRKVNAEGCEADSDGDGVVDALDNCPATPAGRKVNALGCELDSDGDGVVDALDKCPATPAGRKVNAEGCEPDSDGDGVVDTLDNCPATPAGRKVNALGCELDSDGDGVVDALDKCPATPAGRKVNAEGCELDSDGDGVVDGQDACPNTPKGDKVDARGCTLANTITLKGVKFDSDTAKLRPESKPILDEAAEVLKRYPHVNVEVAGHADNRYTDAYNQELSQKRAGTVCDYFIQKGIDAQRLRAKGYGETQPVADNKTKTGREENRRVELRLQDK
jgi:outer membrane protein OmpA-like peptidoglycan-associated protein